jgi:hypothetical protein
MLKKFGARKGVYKNDEQPFVASSTLFFMDDIKHRTARVLDIDRG